MPALDGLLVLSLAEQFPGPLASMILADLGATVVLIERPVSGDPSRQFPSFFDAMARNKKSVALDLKSEKGRKDFLALAEDADVIIDGFRPGTLDRLGVGRPAVVSANPDVVWVAIPGYGSGSSMRQAPGHDIVYQAKVGALAFYAHISEPVVLPTLLWGDIVGGLFGCIAVLVGVVARGPDHAPLVESPLADGLAAVLASTLVPAVNDIQGGGFDVASEPGYGLYPCADGRSLALGIAHEDFFWQALCEVLHLPEAAHLDRAARSESSHELRGMISERLYTATSIVWEQKLSARDVPAAIVLEREEVGDLLRSGELGQVFTISSRDQERLYVGQPITLDGAPAVGSGTRSPFVGEHNSELLGFISDPEP